MLVQIMNKSVKRKKKSKYRPKNVTWPSLLSMFCGLCLGLLDYVSKLHVQINRLGI